MKKETIKSATIVVKRIERIYEKVPSKINKKLLNKWNNILKKVKKGRKVLIKDGIMIDAQEKAVEQPHYRKMEKPRGNK